MSCFSRFAALTLAAVTPLVILPGAADAQRRTVPHHPSHPQPAVAVRGHVFVGGYFYAG